MKKRLITNHITGICEDYYNEVMCIAIGIETFDRKWLADRIRTRPIRRYEERYSPEDYEWVVTEQNQERVSGLNAVVDRLNREMTSPDSFSEQQLLDFVNQTQLLIYGETKYPTKIEDLKKKEALRNF